MAARLPRAAYLLLGFVMNLMLGTAYAWSVFKTPLITGFGATNFSSMLPFALALAMFSVGMVFAGRLVDKHGPRIVAILGGVLVGAGYMLSSLMDKTPWPMETLTVTYGVIVGLGIGFAYNPPIPTAVRWFPVRKGFASGLVVMGFGLSALFTAPLADFLIRTYGVPTTFLILGILFFVVLVALGAFLSFPPADWHPPAEVAMKSKRAWKPVAEVGTRAMLRSPTFWLAWTLYTLGTAGGFMIIGNAKPLATEVGAVTNAVLATAAVQVLAVFNSGGRPLFGRLADVWGPRQTLLVMYILLLGAMALLSISTGAWIPLYAGIALTGMIFGGFLAVMPALSTLFFGAKNLGTNYGVLFTGYGFGAVVALFASGWIRDFFGSYTPAFYIGIALSAMGLVLSLGVRPPKPVIVGAEIERVPA
jgi:OFA family oxalate/formate antiporter-like MFS transporter